jgi:hypothetical protein
MTIAGMTCTLCGQPAAGAWHGTDGVVHLCDVCARQDVPRLIADSIDLPRGADDRAKAVADQIVAAYWQALALRVLRREKDGAL